MGEEQWSHSSQYSQQGLRIGRMKVLWLVCLTALVLFLNTSEAAKKKPKGKGKGKPKGKPTCPKDTLSKKAKAHFLKYTVTEKVKGKVVPVADQPCWFDLSLGNVCAKCAPGGQKCGSYCDKATSMKCDGVLTPCKNIDKCGFGASCDKKSSSCKCEKGLNGNGFQCFNATSGEPVSNPNGHVEISIDTASKFFVYPDGSELFPPTV